jgi:hypothetical protein
MSSHRRFPIVAAVAWLGSIPVASGQPCAQPGDNCQLPDQGAHGAGFVFGTTSDANIDFADPPLEAVDNFVVTSGGSITNLCWWGFHADFTVPGDCNETAAPDAFTVRYYENVEGFPPTPGALKAGPFVQGAELTVTRAATGNVISPTPVGDLAEFEYSAAHPPVSIAAGECCWISIQNDSTGTTCRWLWSAAPSADEDPPGHGDGHSYQFGADDPINDFDLAFCVDKPLGDPADCLPPIDPGCVGATNPCHEQSSAPGCADPACCTQVCQQLPICCFLPWDQGCVDAAGDVCTVVPPAPDPCPPLAEGNCQLPDLGGSGGVRDNEFIGLVSDRALAAVVADNFRAGANDGITRVCWWGFYSDGGSTPDCSEEVVDDFRVRYFTDDGTGIPQSSPIATFTSGAGLSVTRTAVTSHQGDAGDPADDLTVFQYSATHAAVNVSAGQCYWVEISNDLDGTCAWLWETAPDNGTGTHDDDYSLQDDLAGYDLTDGKDVELGWCLDISLGDVAACSPPTPQESCDPPGAVVLTQNDDPDTIIDDNGITCEVSLPGGIDLYTADAAFARSYHLADIPETAGLEVEVVCVRVAIEDNDGSACPVSVNLYWDTNGGAPGSPDTDLALLGSKAVTIPVNMHLGFVQARFDPPVAVPVDARLVVELAVPNRDPSPPACDVASDCPNNICVGDPNPGDGTPEGYCGPATIGDSGGLWPGTNNLPHTAQSYIRSLECGVPSYLTMGGIGFPSAHLVQEVHVNTSSGCIWDCQAVPNGSVDVADFLALLAQFGQVGTPCDFDGGGVGVTDFLQFLANFGACP